MDGNGDDARIRGGHGRRAVWVVAASGAPWIGGVEEGALDVSLSAPAASGAPWIERVEEGALHLSLSVLVESFERNSFDVGYDFVVDWDQTDACYI